MSVRSLVRLFSQSEGSAAMRHLGWFATAVLAVVYVTSGSGLVNGQESAAEHSTGSEAVEHAADEHSDDAGA